MNLDIISQVTPQFGQVFAERPGDGGFAIREKLRCGWWSPGVLVRLILLGFASLFPEVA